MQRSDKAHPALASNLDLFNEHRSKRPHKFLLADLDASLVRERAETTTWRLALVAPGSSLQEVLNAPLGDVYFVDGRASEEHGQL